MPYVLDASAYLAYVLDEPGADVVERAMGDDETVMSIVNVAEVFTWAARHDFDFGATRSFAWPPPGQGAKPGETSEGWQLSAAPDLPGALSIAPFDWDDAGNVAALWPVTRPAGLSLGDRACLALAWRFQCPALTADRIWATLNPAHLRVIVQLIR